MEWIVYVAFIFMPIVLIWMMLWAIEKKIPARSVEGRGNK